MRKKILILLGLILSILTVEAQKQVKEKELFLNGGIGIAKTGVWKKYELHHFQSYTFQADVNYLVGKLFKYGIRSGIHYSNYTDLRGMKTNYLQIPVQLILGIGKKVQFTSGLGVYYGILTNSSAPYNVYNSGFEEVNRNSFGFIESLGLRVKIKNKHSISLWVQNKHDLTTQYKQTWAKVTSPDTYFVAVKTYSLGFGLGYQYVLKNKFFEK